MSAARRDDLLSPAMRFGGSVLVVAGPWLVFVAIFGLASLRLEPIMGRLALEDLRLAVVYAFCLSPLVAAPVASIAARMIDVEAAPGDGSVFGIVLSALGLAGAAAMGVAGIVALALEIAPTDLAIAYVFFSGAVAQLWVVFAVLAARRAYGLLIGGFVGCLSGAAAVSLAMAGWDTPVAHLIWILDAGIQFYVALALARMTREDSRPPVLHRDLPHLLRGLSRNRMLAMGIFCAMAGVWVDKWLMWAGPSGMRTTAGFYHYAPYDTVMFLAHLTTIPAFAALHGFQKTALARAMARIYHRLNDGSPVGTVTAGLADAQRVLWGGLLSIMTVQLAMTICGLLVIPWIAPPMSLDFGQIMTLRIGLLAVFCHGMFIICSVILLQTRSMRHYLGVNLLMLGLNFFIGATMSSPAIGLFSASLIASIASITIASRESSRMIYLNFIGESETLFADP